MEHENRSSFQVNSWNEEPTHEFSDGAKITHARVTQTYSGAISGTSSLDYVMYYHPDGTATFVGLEQIAGTVSGKTGSFVIQHGGIFDGTDARSCWTVVPGSGTGELEGIEGTGSYVADSEGHSEVIFQPAFPEPA